MFRGEPDNTIELRLVTVKRTVGNVISKGLDTDERVVIDGHLQLTSGSRIEIQTTALTGTRAERLA